MSVDSVSLASAVNVAVRNAHRQLQSLAERLPAASDAARKEELARFCSLVRGELLRVYTVVRW